MYSAFLKTAPATTSPSLLSWLAPSGTYQWFIALINSACLARMGWLLAAMGGARAGLALIGSITTPLVTFIIQNAYARLMIASSVRRLHVRIDTAKALSGWAGRNWARDERQQRR